MAAGWLGSQAIAWWIAGEHAAAAAAATAGSSSSSVFYSPPMVVPRTAYQRHVSEPGYYDVKQVLGRSEAKRNGSLSGAFRADSGRARGRLPAAVAVASVQLFAAAIALLPADSVAFDEAELRLSGISAGQVTTNGNELFCTNSVWEWSVTLFRWVIFDIKRCCGPLFHLFR